ncbi:MAG: cell division protein FtsL [Desulfamplus sp.]|nr:cell division protein FtsL [Desulfamplus sp.]
MAKPSGKSDSTMQDEALRLKKKMLGKWMAVIAILLAELFLYTLCRVNYTETGFRISHEKNVQKNLRAYQDSLIIEHERLLSPERVAGIARTRLNLKIPTPDQVIYMDM